MIKGRGIRPANSQKVIIQARGSVILNITYCYYCVLLTKKEGKKSWKRAKKEI